MVNLEISHSCYEKFQFPANFRFTKFWNFISVFRAYHQNTQNKIRIFSFLAKNCQLIGWRLKWIQRSLLHCRPNFIQNVRFSNILILEMRRIYPEFWKMRNSDIFEISLIQILIFSMSSFPYWGKNWSGIIPPGSVN